MNSHLRLRDHAMACFGIQLSTFSCSLALVLAGLLVARAAFLELRKRGSGRPGTPPMTAGKRAPVSIAKYSRHDPDLMDF